MCSSDLFLGAMNDNVFKNGMIIFMAFGGMTLAGMDANVLVNAAGAVFILPFVLFSAFAGQLADKYEKRYSVAKALPLCRLGRHLPYFAGETPVSPTRYVGWAVSAHRVATGKRVGTGCPPYI